MKKLFNLRIASLFTLVGLLSFYGCKNTEVVITPTPETNQVFKDIGVAEAKAWYEQTIQANTNARAGTKKPKFKKNPTWKTARQTKFNGADAVIVMFQSDNDAPVVRIREGQVPLQRLPDDEDVITVEQLSDLIIYQKGDQKVAEVITRIPEREFYQQRNKSNWKFSGLLLVSDTDDNLKQAFRFKDGRYESTLTGKVGQSPNGRPMDQPCIVTDWYTLACGGGQCYLSFDYTDYSGCSSVGDGGYGGGSGMNYYEATNYNGAASSGGTGATGVAVVQIDADKPIVTPYQQVKCFLNNNDDYTYELTVYVDQPGEDVDASWWFDSGHVFVRLKKTSRNDGSVIQRTFGFYPENNLYAVTGSSGKLHTNEGTAYDVSITHPISPQQMTAAANAAYYNGTTTYVLSDFNCTDYAKSICNAAGVYLPIESQRLYIDNSTLWIHSPGKLGGALRRAKSSMPDAIDVRSPNAPKIAPYNIGNCP